MMLREVLLRGCSINIYFLELGIRRGSATIHYEAISDAKTWRLKCVWAKDKVDMEPTPYTPKRAHLFMDRGVRLYSLL